MNYWISSDFHYGHVLVEKERGVSSQDIFNKHNIIPKGDILICLGDVSFGDNDNNFKNYLENTPYKKILIMGNHDKQSVNYYLKHGWDFVIKGGLYLDMYGIKLFLTHKPTIYRNNFYEKEVVYNLHGHYHDTNFVAFDSPSLKGVNDNSRLFALEYLQYSPLKIETVTSLIKKNKWLRTIDRMEELINNAADPIFYKNIFKINNNGIEEKYFNEVFNTDNYVEYLKIRGYMFNIHNNCIIMNNNERAKRFYEKGLNDSTIYL